MLKLIGENGKSIIAEALSQYKHMKIYVYAGDEIPSLNAYYLDARQYSVKEFCEFVYEDLIVSKHTDMVVLYIDLYDTSDMEIIRCYAERLEEGLAERVVVATKNVTVAH